MEALISLQSTGHRSIGEPTAPRPIGVEQGAVLVVLDVNKGASPAALYWALTHVVRKGDTVKILGIITHIASASKSSLPKSQIHIHPQNY
jgi:glycerol-3-phosphate acyltransferase PlsY